MIHRTIREESPLFPFTALGWGMDNRQGLSDLSACNAQAETFKQVIHEESIKVAGASKAPDYTFRHE